MGHNIMAIRGFTDTSQTQPCPVIKWQHILGWINWPLNTYLLVCPSLQYAYAKISGKQISRTQLYLNRSVIHDFHWLADTIEASDGIHMLNTIEWDSSHADLIVYSDTSLNGLGFCVPNRLLGFCASTLNKCLIPQSSISKLS